MVDAYPFKKIWLLMHIAKNKISELSFLEAKHAEYYFWITKYSRVTGSSFEMIASSRQQKQVTKTSVGRNPKSPVSNKIWG